MSSPRWGPAQPQPVVRRCNSGLVACLVSYLFVFFLFFWFVCFLFVSLFMSLLFFFLFCSFFLLLFLSSFLYLLMHFLADRGREWKYMFYFSISVYYKSEHFSETVTLEEHCALRRAICTTQLGYNLPLAITIFSSWPIFWFCLLLFCTELLIPSLCFPTSCQWTPYFVLFVLLTNCPFSPLLADSVDDGE